jgi:hypothetical protein
MVKSIRDEAGEARRARIRAAALAFMKGHGVD